MQSAYIRGLSGAWSACRSTFWGLNCAQAFSARKVHLYKCLVRPGSRPAATPGKELSAFAPQRQDKKQKEELGLLEASDRELRESDSLPTEVKPLAASTKSDAVQPSLRSGQRYAIYTDTPAMETMLSGWEDSPTKGGNPA